MNQVDGIYRAVANQLLSEAAAEDKHMVTCKYKFIIHLERDNSLTRLLERGRVLFQRKRPCVVLKDEDQKERNRSFCFMCVSLWKGEALAFNRKVRILCQNPVLSSVYLLKTIAIHQ